MKYIIHNTGQFKRWLKGVKDPKAKVAVALRVKRLEDGLFGDAEPVGNGVTELRIHVGKGYRVYCKRKEQEIIFLLGGGHKGTQEIDIKKAKALAKAMGI